jgi:hypothetical protein
MQQELHQWTIHAVQKLRAGGQPATIAAPMSGIVL